MGTASKFETTIEKLNHFLRDELSAVDTYELVLSKLDQESPIREELASCKSSHHQRALILQRTITQLGGTPVDRESEPGRFAEAIDQSIPAAFGDKSAILALEKAEDHELADYRTDIEELDGEARQLIVVEVLPEQELTHRTLAQLKRELH